jgi:anaerobic magnesium-protoporphyrin IX monomethyl ester cyclase
MSIDCILVGLAIEPVERHMALAERAKDVSGGYQHLLANTARFNGKRESYFEIINAARRRRADATDELHYARVPSLATLVLGSFLTRAGVGNEIIHYFNAEQDRFRDLLAQRPRVVAITTTFYIDNGPIKMVVDFVREHSPETRIVVGGPRMFHIFADAPTNYGIWLDDIGADIYINDSQGELTLARLCRELARPGPDLSTIPNLVYGTERGRVVTPREPEANDMNELTVDWERYLPAIRGRTVTMRTARSCAFRCAFCRYPVMAGALSLMDVDVVERELERVADSGVRVVMFIDDTFNIPPQRFKELCRMMIRRKFDLEWLSYFRCANADDEAFDLMAEAGCVGTFLGIESGDQTVLKAMNKGATAHRYRDGIGKLKDRGILTYATFIAGHPGETDETIRNTIDFIQETAPNFYSMEPYYHDTRVPIAARSAEYGIRGRGYSWEHNTMDWKRATEWSIHAYETIDSSIVLPLNNFDLWSVGYLRGEGFALSTITDMLRVMSKMVVRGLRDPARDFPELEEQLVRVLEGAGPAATLPAEAR